MASDPKTVVLSCHICQKAWTDLGFHHICRLPGGYLCCESCGSQLLHHRNLDTNKEGCGKGNDCGGEKSLEVGCWGGNGDSSWDDGIYDGIREIMLQVSWKGNLRSIQVVYDKDGRRVISQFHRSPEGIHKSYHIILDYPTEYITCVSGHVSLYPIHRIRSIEFKTNKRMLGPYGVGHSVTPFNFPLVGMRIVGFKGRSGEQLEAIGLHLSMDSAAMKTENCSCS
ncbi:hypothetical protein MLD38_004845 [Melastoma candidum]|uniref:Uncharacterized protein n=1 Tax=Melastoma candidum TaxID=119954 RepID=A0ACB9S7V4_9MYRT|nr:hypothetical protein MLD38_004845 [Melastoma candidum]